MKKTIFIFAALAVLFSCAKEENLSAPVAGGLRYVSIDVESVDDVTDPDDSKAWFSYISEGLYRFKWVNKEEVGAFDSKADVDGGHTFTASNKDNNKATLTGEICEDATGRVVFLCPKQSNTYKAKNNDYKTNVSGNKITSVLFPYKMSYKPKFFDGKSATRIGVISDATKIESEKLNMYNPLAAIRFTLKNCSDEHPIVKIEVFGNYGEMLAGYGDIDFTDPTNPKTVFNTSPFTDSGAQRVSHDLFLTPKTDVETTFGNNEYAATLVPTNFTKGLMFKFIDSKGNVAFKGSSDPLDLKRNHMKNIGTIDVSKLDWHYAINLQFMEVTYERLPLPFVEQDNDKSAGDYTRTFNLQDGSGKSVVFNIHIATGKLGRYDKGLEIGGSGSYMEIPAIEGKVLKTIFFRCSSTGGNNGNPCIVRASDGKYLKKDGTWAAVPAGASISDDPDADIWTGAKKTFGWYKQWKDHFEAGERYRIYVSGSETCKMRNLVLLYDDATKATALTSAPQVNDWVPGEGAEALMY